MALRACDCRGPRGRCGRVAGKKRRQRCELECVISGELFDPGKSSDVDRNLQRIHVTIRPLNREDSVLYFPPEAFGPFRVLHQIGAGTLGPVFRAYEPADAADERRDRLVAIKVFRLDLTPEQSAALVTALEALIDAHINHPNIAAPIAAGLDYGAAYLAQEYAVGDSLDVVLRERGPMPVQDVAGARRRARRGHRPCSRSRCASRPPASARYRAIGRCRADNGIRHRRRVVGHRRKAADASAVLVADGSVRRLCPRRHCLRGGNREAGVA